MSSHLSVRDLARADLPAVSVILDKTALFPPEFLADMAEPFLAFSESRLWLVACEGADVLGFAFCEPERMTDKTFNLLAIAVHPDRQKGGVGKALVHALDERLTATGGRLLGSDAGECGTLR